MVPTGGGAGTLRLVSVHQHYSGLGCTAFAAKVVPQSFGFTFGSHLVSLRLVEATPRENKGQNCRSDLKTDARALASGIFYSGSFFVSSGKQYVEV